MPIIQADDLEKLVASILAAAGARVDYADIVATHLVNANLAGHDSHGVIRTPHYVRSIDQGQLQPTAVPEIVRGNRLNGADLRQLDFRPDDRQVGHGNCQRLRLEFGFGSVYAGVQR